MGALPGSLSLLVSISILLNHDCITWIFQQDIQIPWKFAALEPTVSAFIYPDVRDSALDMVFGLVFGEGQLETAH